MHPRMLHEHKIRYVCSIMVGGLLWSQWYEGLLPEAFQEELCEALLSRVPHSLACNAGATTF